MRPVKRISIAVLLLITAVALWWLTRSASRVAPATTRNAADARLTPATGVTVTLAPSVPSATAPGQAAQLPGEKILRDFGKPSLPPENDLTLVSRLMDNFTLLVKSAADRPLSANEDWAAALRGNNPARERFLPDRHPALDTNGQLVDRWGTPLFFHALGGRRYELRSAGPDKKMWTEDDVHRNADGSFLRGAALNPPSLRDR